MEAGDFARNEPLARFRAASRAPARVREIRELQVISLVGGVPTSAQKESAVDASAAVVAAPVQHGFESVGAAVARCWGCACTFPPRDGDERMLLCAQDGNAPLQPVGCTTRPSTIRSIRVGC